MAQFGAEFARAPAGLFDRFIDALNRLPRPALALGTLGLFVSAMVDPVWFASRMQGIALVPEPLWWLMGAIVSFYFGARYQAKGQDFQRSIAETMARTGQVDANLRALAALRCRGCGRAGGARRDACAIGRRGGELTGNAALEDWRRAAMPDSVWLPLLTEHGPWALMVFYLLWRDQQKERRHPRRAQPEFGGAGRDHHLAARTPAAGCGGMRRKGMPMLFFMGRSLFMGRGLARAIARNARIADELDLLLRRASRRRLTRIARSAARRGIFATRGEQSARLAAGAGMAAGRRRPHQLCVAATFGRRAGVCRAFSRRRGRGRVRAMIAEYGHFALVLALLVALVQMRGADGRGAEALERLDGGGRARRAGAVPAGRGGLRRADARLRDLGFLAEGRRRQFQLPAADALQVHRHLGQPRGVAAALGADPDALRRWGGAVRAATCRKRCGRGCCRCRASVSVAFLAFLLFTSNPFLRLAQPPLDGADLNPLLQDPGLAFHPPFLYLGYVGLSMAFSFAIAALIEGRVDAAWGRWVRPWTLAAWMFLTVGIAMGSWWAYYELGWGGFWFWDPVENASFMPWLIATALLHSAIVVEKREALKAWTVLLAIIAFGFSLTGTFIVRSGVITSVHSFANDPARGVFILVILALFVGGGLTLFAARAGAMEAKGLFALVSREGALVANNILLAVAAFVVFVGTLWPLFAEMVLGRKLSVGRAVLRRRLHPLHRGAGGDPAGGRGAAVEARRGWAGRSGRCAARLRWRWRRRCWPGPWAPGVRRWRRSAPASAPGWWPGRRPICGCATGSAAALPGWLRLPRADWGRAMAHGGLGVTMFGIAALIAWNHRGYPRGAEGRDLPRRQLRHHPEGCDRGQGPNYFTTMGDMVVARDGKVIAEMHPEKRRYPVAGMPTTEAAIRTRPFGDLYLVLGDAQDGGGWAVRTYVKPFALWIWGGALLMAFGGLLSLSDRRYRVAAGAARARGDAGAGGMRALLAALLILIALPALAVEPGERLADPALEARARAISQDLRCPVCQGENIDDSNADIAGRPAQAGARAAGGRRQRRAGDRLCRRPLRRIRAVQAAGPRPEPDPVDRRADRCCCWGWPSPGGRRGRAARSLRRRR